MMVHKLRYKYQEYISPTIEALLGLTGEQADDIILPYSPKGIASPAKDVPKTILAGPLAEVSVRNVKFFTLEEWRRVRITPCIHLQASMSQ